VTGITTQTKTTTILLVGLLSFQCTRKKWFCYGNKIGTTDKIFVTATKNFATATKRFVDKTKHLVVVTKFFCYPYFNK